MTEPKLSVTPAGYAIDAQALLDEVQRLEGLVASLTAERDRARDLAVRCGVFTNSYGEEPKPHKHRCGTEDRFGYRQCDDCPMFEHRASLEIIAARRADFAQDDVTIPEPNRPSAYDMPVGSVVVAYDYDGNLQTYTRMFTDAGNHGWAREKDKPATVQSGWVEGLFSDGLVTEWRLP